MTKILVRKSFAVDGVYKFTNDCTSSENVTTINISLFVSQMHKGRRRGF